MAREMKDSGIEWIGEIPKDWKFIKLKNIMTFLNGYAFEGDNFSSEGSFSVIKIGDIFNNKIDLKNSNKISLTDSEEKNLEKFIIKKNDILIAMSGATVGKLAFINDIKEKAYINQRVGILRNNKNIASKYLFYSLLNDMFLKYIYLLSIGSAQPNISSVGIENYTIVIPPLKEQKKIVNYLDKKVIDIDLIIEKTKTTIEDYKKYKQSTITEAVTKGLNPNVETKDSGIEWIGQIPKHWEVIKQKYLVDIIMGQSPNSEDISSSGKVLFMQGNKDFGNKYPNPILYCDTCKKYSRIGDILLSVRAPVGALNESDKIYGIGRGLCSIKPLNINKSFLKYYLEKSKEDLKYYSNGSTFEAITIETLKEFFIVLPLKTEQQQIVDYLDKKVAEIDNLITKKESLINEMEEYKKSLIYEYVTGKKEIVLSKNKIISFIPKTKNLQFAKAVLVAKIADELNGKKGKVAIAKILYLIETHLSIEFNSIIERQVAGPLDSEFYKAESILKKDKWFKIKKLNYLETYIADEKKDDYKKYYVKYFGQINDKIENIIDKLKNLSTEKLEMIATMYASINDFKIKNQELDKEKIIEDIFSWNKSKERFSKEKWLEVFETLNNLDLIPNGYGKSTIKK